MTRMETIMSNSTKVQYIQSFFWNQGNSSLSGVPSFWICVVNKYTFSSSENPFPKSPAPCARYRSSPALATSKILSFPTLFSPPSLVLQLLFGNTGGHFSTTKAATTTCWNPGHSPSNKTYPSKEGHFMAMLQWMLVSLCNIKSNIICYHQTSSIYLSTYLSSWSICIR